MSDLSTRLGNLSPAKQRLFAEMLAQAPQAAEPIAIVGMACRFPGAKNLAGFWRLISEGIDATSVVPPSRWDAEAFYDPEGETAGKMSVKWGGFIDDIDQFDPTFFGIAPREASQMDPQQRLLLEVAWETLEHANLPADKMAGSRTGVFVGIGGTDYSKIPAHFDDYLERINAHVGTGNALSIAANRLSYIFDFHGPSFAVDTACSSGLVALHSAVMSLRNHECEAALAGAVNCILSPETTIAFSKARMLSSDGRCRPFDDGANGYVRGEGCALVMLKRLTDAVRDGDEVLAVVRGAAINQDGRTSGITAPNSQSQEEVIRAALAQGGLTPADVSYVEAHGTGTPLGDPIEFQSLTKVFAQKSPEDRTVHVTSAKANIGHTETVSGMAGLLKTVMLLQHGKIYPQLHLEKLNSNINLTGSRLVIPQQPTEWTSESGSRIAGVSSFGFGGTNAHVVVEEAGPRATAVPQSERPLHLLTLSSKSDGALAELAQSYAAKLAADPQANIADVAYSANIGRTHFNQRATLAASSASELQEQLTALAQGNTVRGVKQGRVKLLQRPKIAMLFTGQGSQFVNMGRGLYESQPVFREAIDECDEILRHYLEQPLIDVLYPAAGEEAKSPLDETAYTQPALFAIEYATARLWESWGVRPDIVLGHSVGEFAAAVIAGVFSLEDGVRLIALRGQLMQQLPREGKMAAVFAPRAELEKRLAPFATEASIAALNGPESTVISGKSDVIDQVLAELAAAGIKSQQLTVSHAFHSPLMEPMLAEFENFAAGIECHDPQISLISNLTAQTLETAPNASYWRDHVRQAVRFHEGMEALLAEKPDVILEVGPQPHLIGMARRFAKTEAAWVPSLRKGQDDWQQMLGSLSDLYLLGADIDWQGFDRPWPRTKVQLPHYPFQRTRQWMDGPVGGNRSAARGPSLHPLLGSKVTTALETRLFESRLSDRAPKYLVDHKVQGSVVVPGAAYLEMALAAGEQVFGPGRHVVEDVAIQQPMFLNTGVARSAQTSVSAEMGGQVTVEIYSSQNDEDSSAWTMHACGRIRHGDTVAKEAAPAAIDVANVRDNAIDVKSREEIYELIAQRGLAYGPTFQVLGTVHRLADQAVADVELPEATAKQLGDYDLHPALLDGMLQMMASIVPLEDDGSFSPYTYMPTGIRRLRMRGDLTENMTVYARRTAPSENVSSPDNVIGDVLLLDADGNVLVELLGVRIQRVGRQKSKGQVDVRSWLYEINWQPQPLLAVEGEAVANAAAGVWLVFDDEHGIATSLADTLRAAGGSPLLVKAGDAFARNGNEISIDPLAADDYQRLISEARGDGNARIAGVVHLWSGAAPRLSLEASEEALVRSRALICGSALKLIQSLARHGGAKPPKLWLVTRSAQEVSSADQQFAPAQTSLWGFGRVAAMEHPELKVHLVDLDGSDDATGLAKMLALDLLEKSPENQLAYRNGQRFAARLQHAPKAIDANGAATNELTIPADGPCRLKLASAGSMDGLTVEPFVRQAPPKGHVEIEVRATGLNFSDVLKAMGLYPGIKDDVVPMGIECGGIVTRVGEGVDRFQVGDEVMGVAPYSFATHAITTEYAIVHKPKSLDFEEAATVPITFLTAYYALVRLAQVQPGERVLIHAGAGGVGLAAIQICKHLGAEIFVTAGSQSKHDYLRTLGVDKIYSSRSLDFAEQILADTNREGVDVVLNSLPGEAIPKSLGILRAYGRFLEIGKTDIYSNRMIGLEPFQDNLSYFAIDLDRMLRQRPDYIRTMFAEMMQLFEDGICRPLPLIQFTFAEIRDSFRFMAQRKNVGKVVVSVSDRPVQTAKVETQRAKIGDDGTYLITGGLGALGLRLADWLGGRGAKYVALMSRRGPDVSTASTIAALEQKGLNVAVVQGDVADAASLRGALKQIPKDYPPLRGVVHAAGVLDDGILFDMDLTKLDKAMQPKVRGAWNLHAETQNSPLDFFVLFSSIAAVFGSPGQANYAAGNAFLDGLAAYRRGQGLPALAIAWGPWADAGMAATAGRDEGLASRGMELLPAQQALDLFGDLLKADNRSHVAVLSAHWHDLLAQYRHGVPPLLTQLAAEAETEGGAKTDETDHALRSQLVAAEMGERTKLLVAYFAQQLAKIMGLNASDLQVDQPLNTMGLDSLMAIELKNTVETKLAVSIPMATFMEGPSVTTLAAAVAKLLDDGEAAESSEIAPAKNAEATSPAEVESTLQPA